MLNGAAGSYLIENPLGSNFNYSELILNLFYISYFKSAPNQSNESNKNATYTILTKVGSSEQT